MKPSRVSTRGFFGIPGILCSSSRSLLPDSDSRTLGCYTTWFFAPSSVTWLALSPEAIWRSGESGENTRYISESRARAQAPILRCRRHVTFRDPLLPRASDMRIRTDAARAELLREKDG